jgi:hypothetical protein
MLAEILAAITAVAPSAIELITVLRNKDGSVTVIQYLDSADAKVDAGLKQNMDWLTAHPKG